MIRWAIEWIQSLLPTKECWRPVVGYEGFYEVSNLGRVRSLSAPTGLTGRRPRHSPLILQPHLYNGSLRVSLTRGDGKSRKHQIARLVAETFLGPAPEHAIAEHIDRNATKNAASNLQWMTRTALGERHTQNLLDAPRVKGECVHTARVNTGQVFDIRRRAADGESDAQLAREFNVGATTIRNIRLRLTWKHID